VLFDPGFNLLPNAHAYSLFDQTQKTEQTFILALFYMLKDLMKCSSDVVGSRFHRFSTNTHIVDFGIVNSRK
jgi:hypothetical protein